MQKRFYTLLLLSIVVLTVVLTEAARTGPAKRAPIHDLLDQVKILSQREYRDLVIYPIMLESSTNLGRILTLNQAMDKGVVTVSEVDTGSVNEARVWNKGGSPVFIMAGDGLKGAKQDRVSAGDVLVPPESKITIPVYCVEQGRWQGASMSFHPVPSAAPPLLRSAAEASGSQSMVWAENDSFQRRAGVASESKSLNAVYDSPEVQARSKPYLQHFDNLPELHSKTCGVVVMIKGGQILCADLFYSPDLFHRLWPKLLKSYVADVLAKPKGIQPPRPISPRAFLEQVLSCRQTERKTPGLGHTVELRGDRSLGSALIYEQAVVHLDLFPNLSRPVPLEQDNSLQYRRDRLQRPR